MVFNGASDEFTGVIQILIEISPWHSYSLAISSSLTMLVEPDSDLSHYHSIVGAFQYLTITLAMP